MHRTRFLSSLLALAAAAASAAPLPPAKADALRTRFEARQRETRTWAADFTQTLTMPGMRSPIVSEGNIRFRAPDALRIDFTRPAGEWVLATGDRLFLQKPGKRLATKALREDSAGKPILALIGLLQGRPAEDETQFTSAVSQEGGAFVILLTKRPDAGNRLPRRITTVLAEESLNVREVLVELPNGGSLRYAFRDIARNRPLDAAAFTPPREP